jgi:hypothetical protein
MRRLVLCLALFACHPSPKKPEQRDLTTEGERSGYTRTGHYDEAVRLCGDFAAVYPDRVRCETFGETPERRPMVALVVGKTGPVLLIQGGIHAGEIEGKDAGFAILRDVLDGKVAPGLLDAVTIVFVPVLNPDGHERWSPNNRPNQRGPEEMGFRTNAQNLNLNRDYVKAETPEIRALLGLWKRYDPVVYVDLHTTDGAKFEHDIAVMVAPWVGREGRLDEAARLLSSHLQEALTAKGHLPLDFYPSFDEYDDPASGFSRGEASPRYSQAYAAARERIGILVETHSWRTYVERVRSTYDLLEALFVRATSEVERWQHAPDPLAGREVVLDWDASKEARTIEFRGYHYERVPSEISGGLWTKYDETKPEIWSIPLRDELVPVVTVTAPRAGYLVSAGFADLVADRLDAHDIAYTRLDRAFDADVEAFRVTKVEPEDPFEGHARVKLDGAWAREHRTIAAGALWIPIDQPHARLAMHLLEPSAPDSLASWGYFSAVLEQKEYMESYVAEEVAREMLRDPQVKAAFEAALKDAELAKNPRKRLEFFYRRHPSWDERRDLLPVFRQDLPPPGVAPLAR